MSEMGPPRLRKSRECMCGGGIWKLARLPGEDVPEVSCKAGDSAIVCELLSQPQLRRSR